MESNYFNPSWRIEIIIISSPVTDEVGRKCQKQDYSWENYLQRSKARHKI